MIGIGVAAVEIGNCSEVILSGVCRPCLCMQLLPGDRIVSYTASWLALLYTQRQLGNPVRYPDLVTAYREGAVLKHHGCYLGMMLCCERSCWPREGNFVIA
jgi:hypothetical protein